MVLRSTIPRVQAVGIVNDALVSQGSIDVPLSEVVLLQHDKGQLGIKLSRNTTEEQIVL